ncbi:tetratricopeptide repeat protein [Mucisphaera calidilacus]|uniref:Tetratricopeptide repeat protein n=1 Tax=Mucisphaera calidilacus TaxID=2527982 RepID=A0A518BVG4_9BACT|nr:tetratricopeptide repeat protein [Mucisphaera calidilacus]QDU70975.1 tetratricopeptide repeat protein [Mucisphaera calidilacus]
MAIRSKARRRLLLLLVIAVGGVSVIGGFWAFRKQQAEAALFASRAEGVAAYEDERYFEAMHALGPYVVKHRDDAEALYLYALSRLEVEEGDGVSHLRAGASHLRDVVTLNPENVEAKRRLLELYSMMGYAPEALDLADVLLADFPNDAEAWAHKASALVTARRFDELIEMADAILADNTLPEALRVEAMRHRAVALLRKDRAAEAMFQAIELNENAPDDFRGYLLTFETMRANQNTADEVIRWAESVEAEHDDLDGTALLVAMACLDKPGGRAQALGWLKAEVENQPEETLVIQMLIQRLGQLGLLDMSIEMLGDLCERSPSLQYELRLMRYLLYAGRHLEVVERSDFHAENPDRASLRALGYRAQALFELDRGDEAQGLIERLEGKSSDTVALSYGTMLRLIYVEQDVAPLRIVQAGETAVQRDPMNPYFHFWMGQALSSLGEHDRAIEAWAQALRRAPVWMAPTIAITREMTLADRDLEAFGFAYQIWRQQPEHPMLIMNLFRSAEPVLDQITAETRQVLLADSQRLLARSPVHPVILPLHVRLKASLDGRDAARGAIESALTQDPLPDTATLLRLAEISLQLGLEMEDRLVGVAESDTSSPNVVLAQATLLYQQGQAAQARQLMDDAVASASSPELALAMRQVRATVLDRQRDPEALSAWAGLIEDAPNDARLLQRALSMRAIWTDREVSERAIESLRKVTGREAVGWRVDRARWLLGPEAGDEQVTEAKRLLEGVIESAPALVEPRVMLAEIYRREGDPESAVTQLERALELRDNIRIRMVLAQLLVQADLIDEALREYATLIDARDTLSPEQMQQLALQVSALGENGMAIGLLESAGDGLWLQGRLLLASLYEQVGRASDAEGLYETMLRDEEPTLALLSGAARFYQQRGDEARAEALIAGLGEVEGLSEADALMIQGDYYRRSGVLERSLGLYKQAMDLDPERLEAWQRSLAVSVLLGDSEGARALLDGMSQRFPGDGRVSFITDHRATMDRAVGDPGMAPLVLQVVEQPGSRGPALAILDATYSIDGDLSGATEAERRAVFESMAMKLRPVVRMYPRYLSGHLVLARTLIEAGRIEEAKTITLQAVRSFPDSPEPKALATDLLLREGEWLQARSMAMSWRETLADPRPADIRLARAMNQLRTPEQAVMTLDPYIETALESPVTQQELLSTWAIGMIQSGRGAEARQALLPAAREHAVWRMTWLQLIGRVITTRDEAVAWMEDLESVLDQEVEDERLQLALGWREIGQRYDDPALRERSASLLSGSLDEASSARAILSMAIMDDTDGRSEKAEAGYRRVLELEPENPIAANNLSMVLHKRGAHDEAVAVARLAVRVAPMVPTFRDTLAIALLGAGDHDAALEEAQTAVRQQPDEVAWLLTQAEILVAMQRADALEDVIESLDRNLRVSPNEDPDFQQRLQAVRAALESMSSNPVPTAAAP